MKNNCVRSCKYLQEDLQVNLALSCRIFCHLARHLAYARRMVVFLRNLANILHEILARLLLALASCLNLQDFIQLLQVACTCKTCKTMAQRLTTKPCKIWVRPLQKCCIISCMPRRTSCIKTSKSDNSYKFAYDCALKCL